jgi:xylulokinase
VDWVQENIGVRKVYEITGSPPGRRAIYKVMWLKQNEPDVYERIHRIAFIPDYIQYLLTGELASTPGVAMTSGCLNVASPLTWAEDFIAECGVDPAIWIPTIQPAGSVAGRVTRQAAAEIGLSSGTPVVLAAGDQACGNLGVGVCQPGMLGINGGTSCALQTPSERLPIDQAMSYFVDFSPAGYYIAENGITSGTAALTDWFRAEFGREESESAGSEDELWQKLYDLALDAPPGNNGLILVPYLRGANGPLWDPRARGVLVGLMTEHGRGDLMRAIFEGLAYESRKILESMEAGTGVPVSRVRTYGGASQSKVWNQIFADILARPVEVTCDPTPVSLGAAIVAGFGVGLYADPVEAVSSMIHIASRYEPDERFTALYDELYHEVYLHIYPPLQRIIETASRATTHRANPAWPEITPTNGGKDHR